MNCLMRVIPALMSLGEKYVLLLVSLKRTERQQLSGGGGGGSHAWTHYMSATTQGTTKCLHAAVSKLMQLRAAAAPALWDACTPLGLRRDGGLMSR